jgi:hypothetical protein
VDRDREESGEGAECGLELADPVGGDRDLDHAGEGAGELGEAAVLPVAAVRVDGIRDRGDQARAVDARDGEDQSCHAASVAVRNSGRTDAEALETG